MLNESDYRPADGLIAETILQLLARRSPDATICPSEVARALSPDGRWRPLMSRVREIAKSMAVDGRIVVSQRGEVLDPCSTWRGAIRIGLLRP